MGHFCPMCGYNLTPDAVVERDGWHIDPRGEVHFNGARLRMPMSWVGILYALATSTDCVSRDALLNRISNSENENVLCAQVSKLRRHFNEIGVLPPFETVWARGLRWRSFAPTTSGEEG